MAVGKPKLGLLMRSEGKSPQGLAADVNPDRSVRPIMAWYRYPTENIGNSEDSPECRQETWSMS